MADSKTYTVQEFVEKYDNRTSEELKQRLLETIQVKEYVPYVTKRLFAKTILNRAFYRDGKIHRDSLMKQMLYVQALILMYTNIKIDAEHLIDDYDSLDSRHIIGYILSRIPESELLMFEGMIQMMFEDAQFNEYEPHAYVTNQLTKFYPMISEKLNNLMDAITDALQKLDPKMIKKFLEK